MLIVVLSTGVHIHNVVAAAGIIELGIFVFLTNLSSEIGDGLKACDSVTIFWANGITTGALRFIVMMHDKPAIVYADSTRFATVKRFYIVGCSIFPALITGSGQSTTI